MGSVLRAQQHASLWSLELYALGVTPPCAACPLQLCWGQLQWAPWWVGWGPPAALLAVRLCHVRGSGPAGRWLSSCKRGAVAGLLVGKAVFQHGCLCGTGGLVLVLVCWWAGQVSAPVSWGVWGWWCKQDGAARTSVHVLG